MKSSSILLCACLALRAGTALGGTIEGTVVNTSSGAVVPCPAEVVLQLRVNDQFVPFRSVTTDPGGRFQFTGLPTGDEYLYLVGADRHGIFYPGPRIRLTQLQPAARAELAVCDAVSRPSPLVLKKMDITIRPETGLLKVTESLLIDNPTHTTYVGEATGDYPAVTLALSIPPDFQRTTFEKEFYGRHFAVVNNKVVTGIPWTPGERELKYTYIIRNTQEATTWRRPLDLPCSDVTIRIEGKSPDEVRCDLLDRSQMDKGDVVFASSGRVLQPGQVLRIELGRLPLPWLAYGKWAAVAILLALMAVTAWRQFARNRGTPVQSAKKKNHVLRRKHAA
jgi:hypothetical protein